MVVASGIKATFLLLVWLLALDRCLHCVGTICFKSTYQRFQNYTESFCIPCTLTAVMGITVFNTLFILQVKQQVSGQLIIDSDFHSFIHCSFCLELFLKKKFEH
jgi:hypothetical protein